MSINKSYYGHLLRMERRESLRLIMEEAELAERRGFPMCAEAFLDLAVQLEWHTPLEVRWERSPMRLLPLLQQRLDALNALWHRHNRTQLIQPAELERQVMSGAYEW